MLKGKGQWLKAHVLFSKQYRKLNAGTLYFLKENGWLFLKFSREMSHVQAWQSCLKPK